MLRECTKDNNNETFGFLSCDAFIPLPRCKPSERCQHPCLNRGKQANGTHSKYTAKVK